MEYCDKRIFQKSLLFLRLILISSALFSNGNTAKDQAYGQLEIKSVLHASNLRQRFVRSLTSAPATLKESRDAFLEIADELQNQTLVSGEKATFKCKVDGYPKNNVVFTWYKDQEKLNQSNLDPRMKIRDRELQSRLQIYDVYSSDSGIYRCEASNVERRVHTSAHLSVSFNSLPGDTDTEIKTNHLKGRCEIYNGKACQEFLAREYFYIESFEDQNIKEGHIKSGLEGLANLSKISSSCLSYAREAFCYFVFPPCKLDIYLTPLDDPEPKKLCRKDCELLKHDICRNEFSQQQSNPIISAIVNEANCSVLPPTTASADQDCTDIGLPSVVNRKHNCYIENGQDYRGTISITTESNSCQTWPSKMLSQYPELSGGHNFCRNPGGIEEKPWCFVDNKHTVKETCQVPKCDTGGASRMFIIIAAVAIPVLFILIGMLIFCCACRRKKSNVKHTKGIQMDNKVLSAKKTKVPELSGNLLHITGELGDGKFGKVFKAQILSNLHYCPNDPVAVKTLNDRATAQQVQEFQLEMETFSALQHPNVACLKAVVVQLPRRCMIFEHTNGMDLQEYLIMHSPQADFAKPPASISSHASSFVEPSDFIRMAIQVTAGMEYLTSNNFIHRDLAARNVLVFGNRDLKICNLGVVKEAYLSSYYRSPQGGQMLPIRWMAPESLHSWKFSDKSTIWSFGVLLWEMFSYGLQPYCGYSNHEVLDMISGRQLLTCPDQCPAKIYSLMQECWAAQPSQRPQFKDIHAKLVGWEGTSTTRMTSHLAQGIHRQLNNVMRDGNMQQGQYSQYGPQHRIGDDSRYTPYPGVPGGPNNRESASSSFGGTPVPPYSQQHRYGQFSPPQHGGYPHAVFPNYSNPASRSSGSVASSDLTHHQPLRVNNLTSHQELPEPGDSYPLPPPPPQNYYPPGPERTSRPSLDNHSNSDRSFPNMCSNFQSQNGPGERNDSQNSQNHSRPNSRMRPDGSLPLSVYQDQDHVSESENRSPSRVRPVLAPKPPSYYSSTQEERLQATDSTDHQQRNGVNDRRKGNSTDVDKKARSCDSGLPCDEVDSEGADSHQPLLPSSSGLRPLKQPPILPSVPSSVSGSPHVTADSRIS